MEQLGSHWTYFHEIWYVSIFRRYVLKIQVSLKSDKNNRYFTWTPIYISYYISPSSSYNEKCFRQNCTENQNKHFVFSNFFRKSCCLWDNLESYCRAGQDADDNITWRMRIACWIPKATNTHSEYVLLIDFPLQQWLRERYVTRTLPVLFFHSLHKSCLNAVTSAAYFVTFAIATTHIPTLITVIYRQVS